MPAFLTHMVAANNILEQIKDPEVKDIISSHMDAYHSGAQGGDYFYLYHYWSALKGASYKMFGYALHRARPHRFFIEGAQYVKDRPSKLMKAFFLGYITHYCLDYIVHPHINEVGPNPMTDHNTVEYALDAMYARKNGIDALEFDRAAFVEQSTVKGKGAEQISEFFNNTHRRLYCGFRLRPNSYQTTFGYFAKYNRKMFKPSEKQLRWMKLQNKFTRLDLFTMLYYPYEQIKDLYDYEHFYEQIEKAIQRSLYYMDLVNAFWRDERDISVLESEFHNVNFNGIPVTPREERLFFRKAYKKAKLRLL
jgi:hypothetical protein